jgi:hypothetical protein
MRWGSVGHSFVSCGMRETSLSATADFAQGWACCYNQDVNDTLTRFEPSMSRRLASNAHLPLLG